MPRYSWDIKELIFEEDARKMYDIADTEVKRVLISLLWIAGPRTHEITMLQKKDITIDHEEEKLNIRIKTLKLKKKADFQIDYRTLSFNRPLGTEANIYLETIIRYVAKLDPDSKIISYTDRWIEQQINKIADKALNKRLCPYHFRHSVLTWLAFNGASVPELMHFKGARSLRGVTPYIHAKPMVIKLENQRRNRYG